MSIDTQKLKEHPVIQELKEIVKSSSLNLVGGAVVDILEGREPKDYDFISFFAENGILSAGFKFYGETKTAKTYIKDKIIVQALKNGTDGFDFKIGQATYNIKTDKLKICETSFLNKILIPVSFDSKVAALNSLQRIPHWRKKGYEIPDSTYLSLINVVGKYELPDLKS